MKLKTKHMKNSFIVALALLPGLLGFGISASAQKYAPHEQWPFVYEDFAAAEVLMLNGDRLLPAQANVSVTDAKFYYIENDTLYRSARPAAAMRIGEDDYILANSRLMKVLRRTAHGAVLLDTFVDREAMNRSDVGYGFKSSVSSTEKRNIFEGANGATLSLRMEQNPLGSTLPVKNGGEELITKQNKYIYVNGGYAVRAVKSDVAGTPWIDKKALNAFWKQTKVKYSDDDSLAAVAEYLWSEKK